MLIAITGANGFVGKYLSQFLEKENHLIRRIQRKKNKNSFYIKKIDKHTDWTSALQNVDVIIHCAAKVHIFENDKNVIDEYYSFNVDSTFMLANKAIQMGVKKFIFISSIKVLGEETTKNNPLDLHSIPNPQDHYSNSKLKAELALKKLLKNKMELIIIRPPLIYGPGVGANFLKLMNYIYQKYPIPLGKINNKRSILYVGNLADCISKCILTPLGSEKTLLIADSEPLSTTDLIMKISYFLKVKPLILPIPQIILHLTAFFFRKRMKLKKLTSSLVINTEKSNNLIKWNPAFTTDQGLNETVKWFEMEKKKKINNIYE